MLVILEELDNTGKTTIAKMLTQYYKMQGKNVILAKELSTPPKSLSCLIISMVAS